MHNESRIIIRDIIDSYIERNPSDKSSLSLLFEQFKKEDYRELTSRKNFVGHITGSAFVVSKRTRRVLLLEHQALQKMLQPGGHIDLEDDGPLGGAYRELEEETGISRNDVSYRMAVPALPQVPFFIDTQHIPARESKSEPAHYHHDFWYLFLVENEAAVEINTSESNSYQWLKWQEFAEDKTFKQAAQRIDLLTSVGSAEHFFEKVYRLNSNDDTTISNVCVIAVTHIVQNSIEYIMFLHSLFGDRLQILAKPNSINDRIYKQLLDLNISIKVANKDIHGIVTQSPWLKDKRLKCILLDVGGYFSELATNADLNVIGIVEDTENGLKKYKSVEGKLKYPVISVARSSLKENEDKLVGESIVHASDTILRTENRIIDYMVCTVIGYGKIGMGIVGKLKKLGIKPIVLEKNPQRLIKAINDNCIAMSLKNALSKSEVVFCATGTKSLSIHEFRMLRSGAYVVSVTSSDDEFDLSYLNSEYKAERINQYIVKYIGTENYFYLVNDGNPVNFLFGSALNGFIYLVLSEILFSMAAFVKNKNSFKPGLYENTVDDRDHIAAFWLEEFIGIKELPAI